VSVVRIEVLPAGYGDAILVGYGPRDVATHHILVDAGQATTADVLLSRIAELHRAGGRIDLFVVTHIDNDHIGGALKLLGDPDAAATVDRVWFNGYAHLDRGAGMLGPIQGEQLTQLIVDNRLPWNTGWPRPVDRAAKVGGPVVVTRPTRKRLPGGATALVLSPTPAKLAALVPVWERVVECAGLRPGAAAHEEPELLAPGLLGARLVDLAAAPTPTDRSEANGSSIAFVFEYGGRRILLAGDAHPDVLTSMLAGLDEQPYRVDACKLPHHGSQHNVTTDLVAALDCPLWLVSSNGRRFRHPDDVALARIVVHGQPSSGDRAAIAWNYAGERHDHFVTDYPPTANGYRVTCGTGGGLVIDV
jgi:hypothetical protein